MQKIELLIKPLSINKCWQGRRFKTREYKNYGLEVGLLLNRLGLKQIKGYVKVEYKFYLKRWKTTDIDNLIKPIQDILVNHGVIEDDRFIIDTRIQKVPSDRDFIEIRISKKGR